MVCGDNIEKSFFLILWSISFFRMFFMTLCSLGIELMVRSRSSFEPFSTLKSKTFRDHMASIRYGQLIFDLFCACHDFA